MWQIDCDEFRKVNRPFELRNVTAREHEHFVAAFAERYGWNTRRDGETVTFLPPGAKP